MGEGKVILEVRLEGEIGWKGFGVGTEKEGLWRDVLRGACCVNPNCCNKSQIE